MVLRHIVIEFGRNPLHVRQPTAGHRRKVVMLVVVAHVERDKVQRPVVRIRFVALGEHVVLGNEVAGDRMQTHRDQCAHDHVPQHLPAKAVDHQGVEDGLHDQIEELMVAGRLGIDDERPDHVEERLQDDPAELAECGAEQPCLEQRRQIGVDYLVALVAMVLEVVALERHGHRHAQWQVAKVTKPPIGVGPRMAECVAVRYFVHGQRQGVIDDAADAIGGQDGDGPRLVAHHEEHAELQQHHECGDILEVGIAAEQLFDLRILFEDELAATGMRLLGVGPLKVGAGYVLTHIFRCAAELYHVGSRPTETTHESHER